MEKKKDCGCEIKGIVEYNRGIDCNVTNCIFNKEDCHCTAEKITVGPQNASTSADTLCATFKNKTY